ncbi:MAG: hypothetical protein HFJ30_01500 [Clostridia bacterium]|jgi:hypothetical protein|nr:hypothetical protein [Clostridia bacterium]
MENASKAIIIAGGILIGVIILSVLVLVFRPIGDVYTEEGMSLSIEQLEKYNRQFNTFDRSLYGSELISLKNLLEDYNNRILQDADPNYIKDNQVIVYVYISNFELVEVKNDVTGEIIKKKNYKIRLNRRRASFWNDKLKRFSNKQITVK